jgi:cytochrome o ubiquinol oxidase subunit 2
MSGVFSAQGPIAGQERNLIIISVIIMLAVVIPFLITFFVVARKYRIGNKNAKYDPGRKRGPWGEIILWVIPSIFIAALATITWGATHELDPFKPIVSDKPALEIQVVALPWKWLFIYPKQGIATVNMVEFPEQTPLYFMLTADAPMSSFWIPQLGGQIYAMAGMTTQINLMASAPGTFAGENTEINGEGFSGMRFTAQSVTQSDFDAWIEATKASAPTLTMDEYAKLAAPSENNPSALYSSFPGGLYNSIVTKYMVPSGTVPMQMHR